MKIWIKKAKYWSKMEQDISSLVSKHFVKLLSSAFDNEIVP